MYINIILIVFFTIILYYCISYELSAMNCSFQKCDLKYNSEKWKDKAHKFACYASLRTNWMRSFLITYIIMLFVWILYYTNLNMDIRFWFLFFLIFITMYMYLNFDSFHYTYPACLATESNENEYSYTSV
jgi:hypothetical protein